MIDETDFDAISEVRLRMSYNDSALFSADYLAGLIHKAPLDDAKVALNEVIRYLMRTQRSEGAWDLLRMMPPMIVPSWVNPEIVGSTDTNVSGLMDLLFPKPEGERPWRERPPNFFQWQARLTNRAKESVKPTRFVARTAWLERCREDPFWAEAARKLAKVARVYEHRRRNSRLAGEWGRDPLSSRLSMAMFGEVKCRHSGIVKPCRDCANGMLRGHMGWSTADYDASAKARAPGGAEAGDCECCRRGHDWRNTTPPKCLYCAEASLAAGEEVLARRWGGWYWLRRELLNDGWPDNYYAVDAARYVTQRKLGYEPFADTIERHTGRRQIGAFVIPVPWLEDDTKSKVLERASDVVDAMWQLAGASHARSTATSAKRSMNLQRRQTWLWAHRVMNVKITEIIDSAELNPSAVEERNIRRGIRTAIDELQD